MAVSLSPAPEPAGYISLVRSNANFRNLWFGQIVSLLGDWFNLIASAALIASLTGSGLAVGGLFVVRMLAPFFVSPLAGVVSDRYNRKKLLILTDILRGLTVLGFLLVRDPNDVWLLYTLTTIQLGISGFFFPARSAILPDVVSRADLGAANALTSATWSVMLALGAALGGLAAGQWGIYPAFVIDAGTFFLSALILTRIVYRKPQTESEVAFSVLAVGREYIQGLQYLKQNPDIFVVSLLKAAMALSMAGGFQVLQVTLAEEYYVIGEGGSTSLGLMYAVVGAGTGLGPIFARKFTGDRDAPMRRAIALAYLLTAVGLVMIAPLPAFGIVLLGTFLRGFGSGANWVFSTQVLLQTLPDRVRGRVFATEFAFQTLAAAAASGLVGWGLDQTSLGIPGYLWWMSGLTMFFGLLWIVWLWRRGQLIPDYQAGQ